MKIPFLKNFRRGFATNSSSSHSFIYLKEDAPDAQDSSPLYPQEFGWNDFRLSSIREKLFYILTSRIGAYTHAVNEAEVDEDFERLGEEFPELDRADFVNAYQGYVDHQSHGTITPELARDPRVVIFGGNDNSDGSQERAFAVRSGEVDWERSTPEWEDWENLPKGDPETIALRKRAEEQGHYVPDEDDE